MWIMGSVLALAMTFGTYTLNGISERLASHEVNDKDQAERITRVETERKADKEQLDRIEIKIDRLFEKISGR